MKETQTEVCIPETSCDGKKRGMKFVNFRPVVVRCSAAPRLSHVYGSERGSSDSCKVLWRSTCTWDSLRQSARGWERSSLPLQVSPGFNQ